MEVRPVANRKYVSQHAAPEAQLRCSSNVPALKSTGDDAVTPFANR